MMIFDLAGMKKVLYILLLAVTAVKVFLKYSTIFFAHMNKNSFDESFEESIACCIIDEH